MKKNNERMNRSLQSRITAILLAVLMVLFTLPSDVIASITEVSDYQEMEETGMEVTEMEETELEEIQAEEISENDSEVVISTGEDYLEEDFSVKENYEEQKEENINNGLTEVTTEVSNDEFDIIIVDKTEGALAEVSKVLVEDKTTEVSEEILEKIAAKENVEVEDLVVKTLNIELKDENEEETQPEGTVSVTIAIPEEMNEEDFALYYIGDGDGNENPTKVKGTVEDGYFTFDRSHFCQFCLVSTGSQTKVGKDIDAYEDNTNNKVLENANVGWYVTAQGNNGKTGSQSDVFYISTGADLRGLALISQGNVNYYNMDATDPSQKADNFGDVTSEATSGAQIHQVLQDSFENKKIILTNDITMNSNETFIGIGSYDKPFKGEFDGNGYVIKNIAIGDVYQTKADGTYVRDSDNNRVWEQKKVLVSEEDNSTNPATKLKSFIGFFNVIQDAKIKNLGLDNAQTVVSAANTNNTGFEPLYAGLLVAYDKGTNTKLTNIYIYNSKVSARESTHREIYEAGLVAVGSNTSIENCYVMKLSLTATADANLSRQTVNQGSIAILGSNTNIKNTYYLETTYNKDSGNTPYSGSTNVTKVSEDKFTLAESDTTSVVSLLNTNAGNSIYELTTNATHPTFKNHGEKTSAQIKIATVYNGALSGAGGTFRLRENYNSSFGDYYTSKNVTISKGYASFDSSGNSGTDGYLLLKAYKKDNGYRFTGWYSGKGTKKTYTVTEVTVTAGTPSNIKTTRVFTRTEILDASNQVLSTSDGAAITTTEDTLDPAQPATESYGAITSKDTYGGTLLSTNETYIVQNADLDDMEIYAVFSGSPYTVSTLIVDASEPSYTIPDTSSMTPAAAEAARNTARNNALDALRTEINVTNLRADFSIKADKYTEEQVAVLDENGNVKKDDNNQTIYKTVSSGNVIDSDTSTDAIDPLEKGDTSPYVVTWGLTKNGEITLYCTPKDGYAFVAWYLSDNTEPVVSGNDTLLSDSKKNNNAVTISKVKSNVIVKCLVTPAVPVYTFFTDGTADYNGNLITCDMDLNGDTTDETYNVFSDYGWVSLAENGSYPATAADAKKGTLVGKGSSFTLSAKSANGKCFMGWFTSPNPTFDTNGDPAVDGSGKYIDFISYDNEITLTLDAADTYKVYYARFARQNECKVVQNGNVITLKDEGKTAKKVTYQYSGTAAYHYPNLDCYANNGLGKEYNIDNNLVYKSDYAANADAYNWNGSLGYYQLTLDTKTGKGIHDRQIVLKYPGHYTFCFWPADGSVMYTKDIEITAADINANATPTITQVGTTSKFKVVANGHSIKNAFYQLTWVPTGTNLTDAQKDSQLAAQTTCDPLFSTWYRFVKTGQKTSVININGDNGYQELGPNCDGQIVPLSEVGWYTFFIKYDDTCTEIIYKKVTSDMINGTVTVPSTPSTLEEGNNQVKIISKYSMINTAVAVVKGYYDDIAGAVKYGFKFTPTGGGAAVEVWQQGNRNGKIYIVKATNLVAGTEYKVEAIYAKADNVTHLVSEVDAVNSYEVTFTTASATVNASGYYANSSNGTGFRFNGDRVDAHGANNIKTTYSNAGWAIQSSDSNSVETIPTARIVAGTSGSEYILFTYVLHNNTNNTINGYRIGFSADTMIGYNDYAPVSKEEFGFRICDSNDPTDQNANNFVLIANSDCNTDGVGQYTDTCTSKWFGYYYSAYSNAYTEIPDGTSFNGDSGAAFSYQNMTLMPGEVKTISFILGIAPTSALGTVDTNVPKPYIDKNMSTGAMKANSSGDITFRINKVYYQYVNNDRSSTTTAPYSYEVLKVNADSSKVGSGATGDTDKTTARSSSGIPITFGKNSDVYSLTEYISTGLNNKSVNTLDGYKTLFEETGYNYQLVPSGTTDSQKNKNMYDYLTSYESTLYEQDTTVNGVTMSQNNTMKFEEEGWYSFLIDYYEVYEVVNTGQANDYYANRYLKQIDLYVSSADLNGIPYVVKNGSMVQIYNHGSNLYSVTYQLSNTDATLDQCDPLYTTWSNFWHNGQGLVGTYNATTHNTDWTKKTDYKIYQKVNTKTGYKTITQNLDIDGPQGARQLVFTTPGWYTFRLNYRNSAGTAQSTIKYVLITENDVQNGGPRLDVTGNTITLSDNDSGVTKVVYQLTSTSEKYLNKDTIVNGAGVSETYDVDDYPEDLEKQYIITDWKKAYSDYPDTGTDDEKLAFLKELDGTTNEDEFLFLYEYGEGYYYTHVANNLYKKDANTSDWAVFTRIGKSSIEKYQTNDVSDYLIKANYTTGYRTMKSTTTTVDGKTFKSFDGSSVQIQTPGWYTFLITYGDGVTVAKYVCISNDDLNNAPQAYLDQTTGEVTLNDSTYDVMGAYISYATNLYQDRTDYPNDISGLNYYLDNNNKYSWYGFSSYGKTHFADINGNDGYMTMMWDDKTGTNFIENARYIVNDPGWYNVYISYVQNGDKKVIVRHIKLENEISKPVVEQVTSTSLIKDKNGADQYDNRMLIRYTDSIDGTQYHVTKWGIGYFAYNDDTYTIPDAVSGKKIPNNISTWYRMSLACKDFRSLSDSSKTSGGTVTWTNNIGVDASATGRTFTIPVDREGYYVVMVIDEYYGIRIYITEVKDVPILDDKIEYAPKLTVNAENITGVAASYNSKTGAEVSYLKDITSIASETFDINYQGDINKEVATRGNVLKTKTVGNRVIRVVARDGRTYDLKATVKETTLDSSSLANLIEQARKYLNTYEHEEDDGTGTNTMQGITETQFYNYYKDLKIPGAWAEDTVWTNLNNEVTTAVNLINYDSLIAKESFTAPTQDAIDTEIKTLKEKLEAFDKLSVVNAATMVTVSGNTITVHAGDMVDNGQTVEYFIYCAQDVYDVSTPTTYGYRPIRETVWDSWAGITSTSLRINIPDASAQGGYRVLERCGEYNKFNQPTENYTITDVPDGIYTFQIKVDGVVYYENPVVHNTETNSLNVVKKYLGGSNGTGGLIKEAEELLAIAHSKDDYDAAATTDKNNYKPYISKTWINLLSSEIATAKKYYQNAGTNKVNIGQSYKPRYINCSEAGLVEEAAYLHNLMRNFASSLCYGDKIHTINLQNGGVTKTPNADNNFGTLTNADGVLQATNSFETGYAEATKLVIAKGHHTTWGSFAAAGTASYDWTPSTATSKICDFKVFADGEYTIYVKYADNVYEFYYFTLNGYTYPITAVYNTSTDKIDISIPIGIKITELQIADGEYTRYTSVTSKVNGFDTQTGTDQQFKDIWYKYPANTNLIGADKSKRLDKVHSDKIGSSGFTTEAFTFATDSLSIGEQTIYVKIYDLTNEEYKEYFIPVKPNVDPRIMVNFNDTDPDKIDSVMATTSVGNVSWVAYATGDCADWNAMVGAGVHYMAQNKNVSIAGLNGKDDKFTFYFKGTGENKDFIVTIGKDGTKTLSYTAVAENPSSYHTGAIQITDSYDKFVVNTGNESVLGIPVTQRFEASGSGTKITYYTISAYTSSDATVKTSAVRSKPSSGEILTLPEGLSTKNGDEVYYTIKFYSTTDPTTITAGTATPCDTIDNVHFTIPVTEVDDVYVVDSASDSGVTIRKVNDGSASGGSTATQYTIEVKASLTTDYTTPTTKAPIPGDGVIAIPSFTRPDGISGVDYRIQLYDDSDNIVQTIADSYKLAVDARYQVTKSGVTMNDRTVTLKITPSREALNGGKAATKYELYYLDASNNNAVTQIPSADGGSGAYATTITFKNTVCTDKVTVKFYNDTDALVTTNDVTITDSADEKWTVSASRTSGESQFNVVLKRTKSKSTGGKQITNFTIKKDSATGTALFTNEAVGSYSGAITKAYTDASVNSVYVELLSGTEVVYKYYIDVTTTP